MSILYLLTVVGMVAACQPRRETHTQSHHSTAELETINNVATDTMTKSDDEVLNSIKGRDIF